MFKRLQMGLLSAVIILFSINAWADSSQVFKQVINAPMERAYPAVYKALEDARFFVVFEPQISKNLQRFSGRWGENYNRNQLSSIRSMVFCNAWYANQVSNADPDMLALCPLRIGLYEKNGKTSVLFARPSVIAEHSAALSVAKEIEKAVIDAIKLGAINVK